MLSTAALFTSVFVVEIIFSFRGVSSLVVASFTYTPDAPTLLGFAVYSVIVVLLLMLILDLLMALLDPRVREEVLSSMRRGARFLKHWQNLLGLGLVASFVFLAVAAPYLAPLEDHKEEYGSFRLVPA